MGYYTRYVVSADVPDQDKADLINANLERITKYKIELNEATEEIKWYDHEKDMVQLSAKFPDVRFEVSGNGEEQGDVWKQAFLGGKKSNRAKPKEVWPKLDF